MQYKSLLIVIPTRNRADLAITAINSVINQKNCTVEVLVSDNSTEEPEIKNSKIFVRIFPMNGCVICVLKIHCR